MLVPFTGAGISVDTGVPTLAQLNDYLAKVRLFLRRSLYLPSSARSEEPTPRDFLLEFGWPDQNYLTARVWEHLQAPSSVAEPPLLMQRAIEAEILESLRRVDDGIAQRLADQLVNSDELHGLAGDHWRHLLLDLTRADPDLIDTLFKRLTSGKEPGQAHRYLAFLAPVIGIRLFLTYNFDPFIENTLNREGIPAATYDVADGSPLPAPKLLGSERAVLKLHGTRFRLVADSRVQRPLDLEMKRRLKAYLPDEPILLVLGIGGWEERVLDAVELALEKSGLVYWLHFEKNFRILSPDVSLREVAFGVVEALARPGS